MVIFFSLTFYNYCYNYILEKVMELHIILYFTCLNTFVFTGSSINSVQYKVKTANCNEISPINTYCYYLLRNMVGQVFFSYNQILFGGPNLFCGLSDSVWRIGDNCLQFCTMPWRFTGVTNDYI